MKVLGTFNAYSVLSQSLYSDSDSNNSQQPQDKENNNQPDQKPKFDTFCGSNNKDNPKPLFTKAKEIPKPNTKPFSLAIESNPPETILNTLKEQFKIAIELLQKKQYASAIVHFKTIQTIALIHNLYESELKALEAIARIYDVQNKLNLSMSYYYKAFNCADKAFNTTKKAQLANNIATIHADLKQYKTSLKWFKQALFLAYLNNDSEAIDIILDSIYTTMKELNFLNKTVA